MNNIRVHLFFLFILLILLQISILNQVNLFGMATPLLYVYFLLKLPVEMNRNLVLLLSFFMGFSIDVLGNTLGINTLAMSICGFLRFYFIRVFSPRDIYENFIPSFTNFGKTQFMSYAGVIIFIHHACVFTGEFFSFFSFLTLFLKIITSTLLSLLLIFAFESIKFNIVRK